MPLFARSPEQIFGEVLNDVANSTVLTKTSRGSKLRALASALSTKLGRMYATFDLNYVQAFLDGAEGQYLNFFGDLMGLQRLGEQAAVASVADRNIKYYVDLGTFGDINDAASITLTAGTIIGTTPGPGGIRYKVIADTVLPASDSSAYVSVRSIKTGSAQNVGKDQLRYHDFTDYADSSNNTLKVTNEAEIITAADLEGDTNYKFRIANQVLAAENANETAIRLAALIVPGVADVTMLPFHRGIGSYDLLIQSITPTVSTDLVSAVLTSVRAVSSFGIVSRVRGPSELGISLVGTLNYRRLLTSEEDATVIQAATNNLSSYINNLDIAEEFVVQEALESVLTASELIKKVGTTAKPFDNMYLYRYSRLEDNKVRSTILDDFDPEEDERIIVENRYAGATPILIRSNQ